MQKQFDGKRLHLVVLRVCFSKCLYLLFLFKPFCHGVLKLDLSLIFEHLFNLYNYDV